jgi:hypothetical protein
LDVAAVVRTEPPDRLRSPAPIHPARGNQLANEILELSGAQLKKVVGMGGSDRCPWRSLSLEKERVPHLTEIQS